MREQKAFFSKWFPALAVVVLAITIAAGTGFAQMGQGQGAKQGGIAEKAKLFTKDHPGVRAALEAHKRHVHRLMDTFGVVGVGIGADQEGEAVLKVFTSETGIPGLPEMLDGIPVKTKVTGRFYALVDPTARFERPVPLGVSTGHPEITAGTIGARVKDGAGNVFALSNNHVYAAVNSANLGDNVLQPGAFDGGVDPADAIGTLYDYQPISMCNWFWFWYTCPTTNTIDAAIALSSTDLLGNSTPANLYTPSEETVEPYVGQPVKKYGRTTGLTLGTVDAVSVTVDVCYDEFCDSIARFGDQISITPGGFSAGGDSGSLIVSQDGNHPVGLLFAGSDTDTLANRIGNVLNAFDVTIDSGPPAVLTAIDVKADSSTVEVGRTVQFTAIGTYSDTSTKDITADVTWVSSDTEVATINSIGVAVGTGVGTTGITATLGGINSSPVQLLVIASTITLRSIAVTPTSATIEQGQTLQFAATGTYSDDTTADITSSVQWSSSNEVVAIIDPTGLATGVSEGTASITAALGTMTSNTATLHVTQTGLHLEFGTVRATSDGLTRVTLDYDYGDEMVVVCTVNYDRYSVPMPVVPHVLHAAGNSFDVILVRAVGWDFESCVADVHWMAVKGGTYTVADHGIKMEAGKFESTRTDGIGSWAAERIYPAQAYSQPVVLGQVMSLNSYDPTWDFDLWSVFWARGSSYTNPPNSSNIYIGKHSGQDYRARTTETLGYVIIEAGGGSIGEWTYKAGLTSDTIKGVGDKPPYRYSVSGFSDSAVAILSSAAMDGADGGWPILYGTGPIASTGLNLAIDEDWAIDYERSHTSEQAGYIVLE